MMCTKTDLNNKIKGSMIMSRDLIMLSREYNQRVSSAVHIRIITNTKYRENTDCDSAFFFIGKQDIHFCGLNDTFEHTCVCVLIFNPLKVKLFELVGVIF